jgi:hypothetical protein
MVIPILLAGGKAGLPGLGLSMIFGYYFIKGTINAYKYNYQK